MTASNLDRFHAQLRCNGLRIDIRRSVAFRECGLMDGVAFYLSLLDTEINHRVERYTTPSAIGESAAINRCAAFEFAATRLEPTDALIIVGRDGCIVVLRGGCCTFPLFWCRSVGGLRISTALPMHEGVPLSRAGLVAAAAVVSLHSSYEPNAFVETPLQGWRRLRRGVATRFFGDRCIEERLIAERGDAAQSSMDEQAISERVRAAFVDYGHSQRDVASSVVELSGGYDSTLAAAAALTPHHRMHGVSVRFPYYEFRYEEDIQLAVSAALGIPRTVFDGTELFPYAPWDQPPRFEEPAVFVTGIRHAEQVATFAASSSATRIYMGHGGDQLFCTDLTAMESMVANPPTRGPFSHVAWGVFRRALAQIHQPVWRDRAAATFVYDARQDVWVKETFGATIRTPFTDLGVFRAAQLWSRWCAARGARPDKSILAQALGSLLPEAVTGRKGKVAYDGVWMRAYAMHGDHIAATFERAAPVLTYIGMSPSWLVRRAYALSQWRSVSDREVLAAYAVAVWLLAWGVERVSDIAWAQGVTPS